MRTIFADSWFSDFDRLLSQAFADAAVHTRKSETGMIYEFDLPGVDMDTIECTIENNTLYVRGERNGRVLTRAVSVPSVLDWDNYQAHYEHGVLSIDVPLSERAKPKRIEIQGASRKSIEA